MMGVGKTTIGKKLAEILDYYYFDSDAEIIDFTKKSIVEIFTQDGEKYFRKIEKNIIANLIQRKEKMVISLGGGAFMDKNTRKILHQNSIIIWLDANIETLIARTKNSTHRPALKNKNKRKFLSEFQNWTLHSTWQLQLFPPIKIISGIHISRLEIDFTSGTGAPDQCDEQALGAGQTPPDNQQHDGRQHQDSSPDRNAFITAQNDHQRGKNMTNHNQGAPRRPIISTDL